MNTKAIQLTEQFKSITEADEYFEALSILDGFLGGRLTQHDNIFKIQVFFECDQRLAYGLQDDGSRVVCIMDSQRLAVGIGNPYYYLKPQCPIEAKPTRSPAFYDYDKEKAQEMRRYNRIADGLEHCDKYKAKQAKKAKRAKNRKLLDDILKKRAV